MIGSRLVPLYTPGKPTSIERAFASINDYSDCKVCGESRVGHAHSQKGEPHEWVSSFVK